MPSALVKRLLNVTDRDWPRVKTASLLFFLFSCGNELNRTAKDSFFLNTAGASMLPIMYIGMALLVLVGSFGYGALITRVAHRRILVALQLAGAGGMLALWVATSFFHEQLPYLPYVAFITVEAYIWLLLIHSWTYINEHFDPFEGKRAFPILAGFALVGAFSGGMITASMAGIIGANALFLLGAIMLLAPVSLIQKFTSMGYAATVVRRRPLLTRDRDTGIRFGELWKMPLLHTLAFMAFPMWVVIYIIEFNYFETMSRVYPDQNQLAAFLGLMVALCSVTGIIVQFTVTPWILRRFGVGTASLVFPVSLCLGSLAVLVFNLFPDSQNDSLPLFGIAMLIVFSRFCDVAIYASVYDSTAQLLFYAVPERLRAAARTMMACMVAPIGMASAGILLIYFRHIEEPMYNLGFIALALALLLLVMALNITPDYLKALLAHVDPHNSNGRAEILREAGKLEQSDIRYVLLESVSARSEQEALFAVEKLFEQQDEELLFDLEEMIDDIHPAALHAIWQRMNAQERIGHPRFQHLVGENA
jgi:ATP/ADP translocase